MLAILKADLQPLYFSNYKRFVTYFFASNKSHKSFLSTVILINIRRITFLQIPKLLAVAAQSNSIPRDYVKFQNSYYKFHKDSQTWAEARRSCEAEGGHLAILNSIEEEVFLIRLTRQYPPPVLNYVAYVNYFYIGFHDMFEEGDFVTVDGTNHKAKDFTKDFDTLKTNRFKIIFR